jgi:hypothetical protein
MEGFGRFLWRDIDLDPAQSITVEPGRRLTSWVAGSGRLTAASDPTGPEQGEEQN